jgi:hypothetical protein
MAECAGPEARLGGHPGGAETARVDCGCSGDGRARGRWLADRVAPSASGGGSFVPAADRPCHQTVVRWHSWLFATGRPLCGCARSIPRRLEPGHPTLFTMSAARPPTNTSTGELPSCRESRGNGCPAERAGSRPVALAISASERVAGLSQVRNPNRISSRWKKRSFVLGPCPEKMPKVVSGTVSACGAANPGRSCLSGGSGRSEYATSSQKLPVSFWRGPPLVGRVKDVIIPSR